MKANRLISVLLVLTMLVGIATVSTAAEPVGSSVVANEGVLSNSDNRLQSATAAIQNSPDANITPKHIPNAFEKGLNVVFDPVFKLGKKMYGDGTGRGLLGLGFWNPNAENFVDWFYEPWSTTENCLQRSLGYTDYYDRYAWLMGCHLQNKISEFKYSDTWYRVELWKGRYGCNIGNETGIYTLDHQPSESSGKWHMCSPKTYKMCSYLALIDLKSGKILKRSALQPDNIHDPTGVVNEWWWGTQFLFDGYRYPVNSNRYDLTVITSINFEDEELAHTCADSFKDMSLNEGFVAGVFGAGSTTVVMFWSKLFTEQYNNTQMAVNLLTDFTDWEEKISN